MTPKKFFAQLALVSAVVALILALLNTFEKIIPHQSISWISWGIFILFCMLLYWASSKSTSSEDKSLFGKLFLLSIFFKMLLCILIIISYMVIVKPQDKFFIIPFGVVYLFFTVFEVYFVTKLAKN